MQRAQHTSTRQHCRWRPHPAGCPPSHSTPQTLSRLALDKEFRNDQVPRTGYPTPGIGECIAVRRPVLAPVGQSRHRRPRVHKQFAPPSSPSFFEAVFVVSTKRLLTGGSASIGKIWVVSSSSQVSPSPPAVSTSRESAVERQASRSSSYLQCIMRGSHPYRASRRTAHRTKSSTSVGVSLFWGPSSPLDIPNVTTRAGGWSDNYRGGKHYSPFIALSPGSSTPFPKFLSPKKFCVQFASLPHTPRGIQNPVSAKRQQTIVLQNWAFFRRFSAPHTSSPVLTPSPHVGSVQSRRHTSGAVSCSTIRRHPLSFLALLPQQSEAR